MPHYSPPETAQPLNLQQVARIVQGRLHGDGSLPVRGVCRPNDLASSQDLVLLLDQQGVEVLQGKRELVALVADGMDIPRGLLTAWVTVERPRYALSLLLPRFARPPRCPVGVHPSAVVEATADIALDACIGPLTYVGDGAVVGAGARVLANCTLGAGCQIGAHSLLHPGVRIGDGVRIGRRVVIHSNACIGADGFSFATEHESGMDGARRNKAVSAGHWEPAKIPSLGGVVIEDDVEIGACSTIDRATLGDTLIRRASKIDNLVMVGHNSRIGESCLIAGQSGIAGSCDIGDRVAMGGQVGVADHMRIGSDAVIAASSGVSQHVPPQSLYIDTPAVPYQRWQDRYRSLGRLKRLFAELERLKQRLARLEGSKATDSEQP
jgi:UDP-3-O-[3-hydroxymyristoyl] glucosamine N-acyltransferase